MGESAVPPEPHNDPEALRIARLLRMISELEEARDQAARLTADAESEMAAKALELAGLQTERLPV